jgi:hypothetical protein
MAERGWRCIRQEVTQSPGPSQEEDTWAIVILPQDCVIGHLSVMCW